MKRINLAEFPALFEKHNVIPSREITLCNGKACALGVLYLDQCSPVDRDEAALSTVLDALQLIGYDHLYLVGIFGGFDNYAYFDNFPIERQLGYQDGATVYRRAQKMKGMVT